MFCGGVLQKQQDHILIENRRRINLLLPIMPTVSKVTMTNHGINITVLGSLKQLSLDVQPLHWEVGGLEMRAVGIQNNINHPRVLFRSREGC